MPNYRCAVCGSVYDSAQGDSNADLPADWLCPDCGATREDFEPQD